MILILILSANYSNVRKYYPFFGKPTALTTQPIPPTVLKLMHPQTLRYVGDTCKSRVSRVVYHAEGCNAMCRLCQCTHCHDREVRPLLIMTRQKQRCRQLQTLDGLR